MAEAVTVRDGGYSVGLVCGDVAFPHVRHVRYLLPLLPSSSDPHLLRAERRRHGTRDQLYNWTRTSDYARATNTPVYVTLRYITLRYITLHYVTLLLSYVTFYVACCSLSLSLPQRTSARRSECTAALERQLLEVCGAWSE